MKLKEYLLKTKLQNINDNLVNDSSFSTQDYVYIPNEAEPIIAKKKVFNATDFSKINNTIYDSFWLRNSKTLWNNSLISSTNAVNEKAGVLPCICVDTKYFKDVQSVNYDEANNLYTVNFGYYPQSLSDYNFDELSKNKDFKPTGKQYNGYPEYQYLNKKFVYVEKKNNKTKKTEKLLFNVEPLNWIVANWDSLPKDINADGKGTNNYARLICSNIILNSEFHPTDAKNTYLWQNSKIRGMLNSINVNKIKENGNVKYSTLGGGDYTGKGFLNEAFDFETSPIKVSTSTNSSNANPYKFKFSLLNEDELLREYVISNTPIFLHGPSGVGKSQRVKSLDPTATAITLRPQMNPEEIDGVLDRETGKYIPPLWWVQLCEKCKNEPNRKHILFIDELTNVKPTVQSLIYSIVLDRAGKDGMWPLPDNAVVVAAGNETADNLAAYPLTNALFRRFSHIYYTVNKRDWINWATGIDYLTPLSVSNTPTKPQSRIHPAIIAFILSRDEKILNQELDEDNPKIVTDPRKWQIASNVLYATNNPYALKPAIGQTLTYDFVNFVKSINLTVNDVLNENYNKQRLVQLNTSQKLSQIVNLCVATEQQLPKVRTFIKQCLGKEILASFDLMWVKNDPVRARVMSDIKLKEKDFERNI